MGLMLGCLAETAFNEEPIYRFREPKHKTPNSKVVRTVPKKEGIFNIKGEQIKATSKKDAQIKYNHLIKNRK